MGLIGMGMNFKISQRPLEVIYVIDTSGSMGGSKILAVNSAMHDLEKMLKEEASKNPTAEVYIRVITFGDNVAKWHLKDRTLASDFSYKDINNVYGSTPMGSAFNILCDALSETVMSNRSLRPIVVLLSDGIPTDNYENNLERFLNMPWGKKAIKVAVSIGDDANFNILSSFTKDKDLVFNAKNATGIKEFIKWTSTLVSYSSQHANGAKLKSLNIETMKDDSSDF